jgi:hypothetical protein
MNRECCARCVKKFMGSYIHGFQEEQHHDERFTAWFKQLWSLCEDKSPCYHLPTVYGEIESQHLDSEWYPHFKKRYFYMKRTIPPESCPYITEHTVTQ